MNPNRRIYRGLTRTTNSLSTRYILRAWASSADVWRLQASSNNRKTRSGNRGSSGPAHRTHKVH